MRDEFQVFFEKGDRFSMSGDRRRIMVKEKKKSVS